MSFSTLSNSLRIGTSGMQLAQVGLSTVSHNIVNTNTAGYSRQSVILAASSSNGYGDGVKLQAIQRITDRFLTARDISATSDLSYSNTATSYLDTIETTFSGAGANGGIESVIGQLINSANQLVNDPSNTSLRRTVVQNASLTAQTLQDVGSDLRASATTADNQITADLTTVNQLVKDIFTLNGQIAAQQSSANGANANDLLDSRDQKISQLSQYMGIKVNPADNDGVRITTESGRKLVDQSGYVQLSRTASSGAYNDISVQNVLQDGSLSVNSFPLNTDDMTTGEIKALVDTRDTTIPQIISQLDEFASTMATTVNAITSQGTSFPAVNTLTSGSTTALASTTADMLTNATFSGISGATFNISVVDSLGNPVTTTVGGTPITVSPTMPATTMSLDDLAAAINNNPSIGNAALGGTAGVIATTGTDANGKPYLQVRAANANNKIVMGNITGDALGTLGMNNLFTGSTTQDIAVRSDIVANPDLLPVSLMRTDGGVSSTDNQNILALAQLADKKLGFAAAGDIGPQTDTLVGYMGKVVSNLAVKVSDAKDRQTFNDNIKTQVSELATSVSGVNINEELSQMLVYQNSFQASARIITVVNDMLQELVNIIR